MASTGLQTLWQGTQSHAASLHINTLLRNFAFFSSPPDSSMTMPFSLSPATAVPTKKVFSPHLPYFTQVWGFMWWDLFSIPLRNQTLKWAVTTLPGLIGNPPLRAALCPTPVASGHISISGVLFLSHLWNKWQSPFTQMPTNSVNSSACSPTSNSIWWREREKLCVSSLFFSSWTPFPFPWLFQSPVITPVVTDHQTSLILFMSGTEWESHRRARHFSKTQAWRI